MSFFLFFSDHIVKRHRGRLIIAKILIVIALVIRTKNKISDKSNVRLITAVAIQQLVIIDRN